MVEDCTNWLNFRSLGGRFLIKENVVQHQFACQVDKSTLPWPRPCSEARARKLIVASLLDRDSATDYERDISLELNIH